MAQQQTGDLNMTFRIRGDVPKAELVQARFLGAAVQIDDRSLLINEENKGIANVVVHVYTGKSGTQLPKYAAGGDRHVLECVNREFVPRIVLAQVGDNLNLLNSDPHPHQFNMGFLRNPRVNSSLAPNEEKAVALTHAEPTMCPVVNNIVPWMKAWVLVQNHPFAAVSDKNGDLTISGLPTGKPVVFRAFHERSAFRDRIFVNGNEEQWKSNRFEYTLNPGPNNFGIVEIPL